MDSEEMFMEMIQRIIANESNVTLFVTKDPKKINWLINTIYSYLKMTKIATLKELTSAEIRLGRETGVMKVATSKLCNEMRARASVDFVVYHYDTFNTFPTQATYRGETEGAKFEKLKTEGIGAIIGEIDKKMKVSPSKEKFFGILTGINTKKDLDVWYDALYNWSYSNEIWNVRNSTNLDQTVKHHFFVVLPTLNIVGEELLDRCIVVKTVPSTYEERRDELQDRYDQMVYEFEAKGIMTPKIREDLKLLLDRTTIEAGAGLTRHEVQTVVYKGTSLYLQGLRKSPISPEDFNKQKGIKIEKEGLLSLEKTDFGFEMIGGYKEEKEYIIQRFVYPITHPDLAEELGVEAPEGIMFAGPGGLGKSIFAYALANVLHLNLLGLKTKNVLSEWVGQSEKRIGGAFETAENYVPAMIWMDEIESIAPSRAKRSAESTSSGDTGGRILSALLEYAGSPRRKAKLCGATNRPEQVDEDLMRPGRFDVVVPIPYPDHTARMEIARVHTDIKRKVPLDGKKEDIWRYIADNTEWFSGADIEKVIKWAANRVLMEIIENNGVGERIVKIQHIKEAIDNYSINKPRRLERELETMRAARQWCNEKIFINRIESRINQLKVMKKEGGFEITE